MERTAMFSSSSSIFTTGFTSFVASADLHRRLILIVLGLALSIWVLPARSGSLAAAGVDNPVPMLVSLNPVAVNAATVAFTLTANGTNFVQDSVIRWNDEDRPTTFISPTELRTLIPASDVVEPGTSIVTVFNPAPGGGSSDPLTFGINDAQNEAPTITSINPNQVTGGGGDFTLTVNGINFAPGIVVRVNGGDRATTLVSSSQVTMTITAADIAAHGSRTITVFNPPPGGGESEPFFLTVLQPPNPVPSITNISPTSADGGGPDFTLTVNGTNFVGNSVVQVNGSARVTSFVSSLQLTATITAADLSTGGTRTITVFNPAPAGGTSNEASLSVSQPPNPVPTITTINPTSATVGGGDFTLTVNGTNFVDGAVVHWNGNSRTTSFVNGTQLTANIPAADIANTGTAGVTVFNPAPGGGTSNQVSFDITPSCSYTITPLDRAFSSAGGTATITVTAPPGCNWTAEVTDTWITLTPPTSGSGNGSVNYTVATNPNNFNRQGIISVAGQNFKVLQGAFFADVAPENVFFETIGKMSARGVTAGCGFDGQGNRIYCPSSVVNREQMAVFLMRAAGQPNPPTPAEQRFADVPPTHLFYAFIEEMAVRQITSGCGFDGQGNRIYCPSNLVTREQMAIFMVRALGVLSPPTPAEQRFADVPPTHPFYAFIEEMALRNVTSGCGFDGQGNRIYCPTNNVNREQMSAFLVRAFGL